MGIPILLFRLEGILQSWGEHSKWDYRDTADFPSKSGIIGLLGCAMGLERENTHLGKISSSLHMSVRADRAGELITDFQTVSAEVLYSASGKPRGGSNTFITYRNYLQDASFLVGLSGEKELLKELQDALQNPKWSIYLGRKSCVPSVPVVGYLTESYESLKQAMEKYPLITRHDDIVVIEMECSYDEGRLRPDERTAEPGLHYQTRRVTICAMSSQEENNVSE